eukprot:GHVP01013059.1.p1 GENE.GHVP01013059.1~~GHVP01013059.1.p1  ORF type:complete len:1072 (-),score=147.79 GHVP01013059.1:3680-6895(-)
MFRSVKQGGHTEEAASDLMSKHGLNKIVVDVEPLYDFIVKEVLDPVVLFQFFCLYACLYFRNMVTYLTYLVMMIQSCSTRISMTRKNMLEVKYLAEAPSHNEVEVMRNDKIKKIKTEEIVIGDVVLVDDDANVPCDLVLLRGQVIVNEAVLTGESMPLQKFPLPATSEMFEVMQREPLDPDDPNIKKHVLFSGTTVVARTGAVRSLEEDKKQEDVDNQNLNLRMNRDEKKSHTTTRGLVFGIAVRTGSATTGGQMLKDILFPNKVNFKLDDQYPYFLMLMGVYAVFLFISQAVIMGFDISAFFYGVNSLSQSLPIWAPLFISISQAKSSKRLEETKSVYTLSHPRIPIAGKIRVMCWDKTGTLTRDGIDFVGAHCVEKDGTTLAKQVEWVNRPGGKYPDREGRRRLLYQGMTCCHSLTVISTLEGKKIVGSGLEKNMLAATGWHLSNSIDHNNQERLCIAPPPYSGDFDLTHLPKLLVVRLFQFDHVRQTMSAIVAELDEESGKPILPLRIFTKGSFEKVSKVCNLTSVEISNSSNIYSSKGMYVLGLGSKLLVDTNGEPITEEACMMMSRDDVETAQDFLGLLLFRNEPKADARDAILRLREGKIRNVIITGDTALTAAYVASSVGIVDAKRPMLLGDMKDGVLSFTEGVSGPKHTLENIINNYAFTDIAITSSAFEYIKNTLLCEAIDSYIIDFTEEQYEEMASWTVLDDLLPRIRIFSRMTPNNKVEVVRKFMDRGFITGMCGDGGNDCAALKTAHAGIAMSDSEASVVSAFNAKLKTVCSIPNLIAEGRSSLVTAMAFHKMLTVYGILVTSSKVLGILFSGSIMGEMGFLFIDCIILVVVTRTMAEAEPLEKLDPRNPSGSLLGPSTAISVLFTVAADLFFFFLLYYVMYNIVGIPSSFEWNKTLPGWMWWLRSENFEAASIFLWLATQLLNTAFIFSFGGSHRKHVFTNVNFTIIWALVNGLLLYLLFGGPNRLTCLFRVNCDDATAKTLTSPLLSLVSFSGDGSGFRGQGGHNIFPSSWCSALCGIILANVAVNTCFHYFVMLGNPTEWYRRKYLDNKGKNFLRP